MPMLVKAFALGKEEEAMLREMTKASDRSRSHNIRKAIRRYYKHFKKEWDYEDKGPEL